MGCSPHGRSNFLCKESECEATEPFAGTNLGRKQNTDPYTDTAASVRILMRIDAGNFVRLAEKKTQLRTTNLLAEHRTLQVTPAMTGIANHVWSLDAIVALLD